MSVQLRCLKWLQTQREGKEQHYGHGMTTEERYYSSPKVTEVMKFHVILSNST